MDYSYPRMLYRFPGTGIDATPLQDGLYNYLIVYSDADDTTGWYDTPAEARAASDAATAAAAKVAATAAQAQALTDAEALIASQLAPPTRAEMETKAEQLGIKFDGRTSDRKLGDLIAATLET